MSDQEKKKVGIDVLHMVEMPQDTKIVVCFYLPTILILKVCYEIVRSILYNFANSQVTGLLSVS